MARVSVEPTGKLPSKFVPICRSIPLCRVTRELFRALRNLSVASALLLGWTGPHYYRALVSDLLAPRLPRDWVVQPRLFGSELEAAWKPEPSGDGVRVMHLRSARRAAEIQHLVAYAAQQRLLVSRYKNLTALAAEDLGLSYSQLHKILHGAAHMTLAHVASLEQRLGPLLDVRLSGPER